MSENKKASEDGNSSLKRIEGEISKLNPDLLKGLDPGKKNAMVRTLYQLTKVHIGPLPSPDSLAEYNEVLPNAAERIFKEFEEQGKHRRDLESTVVKSQVKQSYIGQASALLIALVFLGAAVWCIRSGYEFGGAIIGVADLASLVAVFLKGKYYQKDNLKKKNPTEN
jgi:uncharacterized membrane protein